MADPRDRGQALAGESGVTGRNRGHLSPADVIVDALATGEIGSISAIRLVRGDELRAAYGDKRQRRGARRRLGRTLRQIAKREVTHAGES